MATKTEKSRTGTRRGAALVWFGTLGGAVAWAAHLTAAWLTEESACAAGTRHVAGTSLDVALVLMTIIPGLIIVAALAVSALAWRKTAAARRAGGGQYERAAFVAVVGVIANILFLLIVAFDGLAMVVFPPCR